MLGWITGVVYTMILLHSSPVGGSNNKSNRSICAKTVTPKKKKEEINTLHNPASLEATNAEIINEAAL